MKRIALLLTMSLVLAPIAAAADNPLPRPAELEPDVQFWIRVYSAISTSEGFIHDQHRLAVVYETLRFDAGDGPRERERRVEAAREHYQDILRRLGSGAVPADPEEQRVRDLWGAETSPEQFALAAEDVRFQLGQSDRFRAGLERAGAWETHIAEVLANRGLPAEIAALPHVESSFDPTAYSKVGAAGLWQFIRSTGRRFLRIDAAVDERLDPYRETEAAAQLLSYNFRLLGSWPLAITAYNHGAEGMRRAREQLGTDDIVRIVRDYHSPSFGFASRNFYVSFLAALDIARQPERYFGGFERAAETPFHEVKLPLTVPAPALARTLGLDRDALRALNPALRAPIWTGQRAIPAGYVLRLPVTAERWTPDLIAQRLGAGTVLPAVAASARAPAVAANARAQVVASGAGAEAATAGVAAAQFFLVQAGDSLASIAASTGVAAGTLASTGGPGGPNGPDPADPADPADPVDYAVGADDSIRVVAAETLGHYADWLEVPAEQLRVRNHLPARTPLVLGRRIRLQFDAVSRQQFEQRRRDYHARLQAAFFATHRIDGTQIYIVRRGDSLWGITQRDPALPAWLLQQYNPDLDFNDLHPGTQVSLPQVEDQSGP